MSIIFTLYANIYSVRWWCVSLFLSFCLTQLKESVMCPVKPCRKLTVRLIDVTRALIGSPWNLCLLPLSVSFSISDYLSVPTRKTKQRVFFVCFCFLDFHLNALYVPSSWLWNYIDCIVHITFAGLFTAQWELYLLSRLCMFVGWMTSTCIAFCQACVACMSDFFFFIPAKQYVWKICQMYYQWNGFWFNSNAEREKWQIVL